MKLFFHKTVKWIAILINGAVNYRLLVNLAHKSISPSLFETLRLSRGERDVLVDSLKVIRKIDHDKFTEIASRFNEVSPSPGYSKYLQLGPHIARNVRGARILGLHCSQPLKILDLGSGAGYFPFICRWYGHRAIALDTGGNEMYKELKDLLRVHSIEHRIEAQKPLPHFEDRFDLITSFQIVFDQHFDGMPWSRTDWEYFLRQCQRLLNPGGRIQFGLNSYKKEHGALRSEILAFFQFHGATVVDNDIVLTFPS